MCVCAPRTVSRRPPEQRSSCNPVAGTLCQEVPGTSSLQSRTHWLHRPARTTQSLGWSASGGRHLAWRQGHGAAASSPQSGQLAAGQAARHSTHCRPPRSTAQASLRPAMGLPSAPKRHRSPPALALRVVEYLDTSIKTGSGACALACKVSHEQVNTSVDLSTNAGADQPRGVCCRHSSCRAGQVGQVEPF